MSRRTMALAMVCAAGSLTAGLLATSGPAERPQPAAGAATTAKFKLADAAFLAGTWKGPVEADRVEETWSAPDGTSILGMFRWINADGTPDMVELLTITEEETGVILRLRHFDAKLKPWDNEAEPMTFTLAETGTRRAHFRALPSIEARVASVTYECATPDELRVLVSFPAERNREPLDFRLNRVATSAR